MAKALFELYYNVMCHVSLTSSGYIVGEECHNFNILDII